MFKLKPSDLVMTAVGAAAVFAVASTPIPAHAASPHCYPCGVWLNGTQSNGISLQGIGFNGVTLQGRATSGVTGRGPGIVLQGISLQGISLQGVRLNGARLNGPILQGTSKGQALAPKITVRAVTLANGQRVVIR